MSEKLIDIIAENLVILTERKYYKRHHVSYDTVLGMENAFCKEGVSIKSFSPLTYKLNKITKKLHISHIHFYDIALKVNKSNWFLYICMSLGGLKAQIHNLRRISRKTEHLLIYCFDTWESQYSEWEKAFNKVNPYCVFFAYKKSKEYFESKGFRTGFIPQSMDEEFFFPRNTPKDRLFMQMGRKNLNIHSMILHYLSSHNIEDNNDNYVYERTPGTVIYSDTNNLAENICKSFFFVCAPQSLENSKLTGNVSDVTARFYEAMACKTIIIGFKPNTYDELFPVDSMVELNSNGSDFEEKITYLIENPQIYQQKVEKNYTYLQEHHRWKNRLENILEVINWYQRNVI